MTANTARMAYMQILYVDGAEITSERICEPWYKYAHLVIDFVEIARTIVVSKT